MAEACQIITIGSDIATRAGFPGVSGHTATEAGVAGSTSAQHAIWQLATSGSICRAKWVRETDMSASASFPLEGIPIDCFTPTFALSHPQRDRRGSLLARADVRRLVLPAGRCSPTRTAGGAMQSKVADRAERIQKTQE
jgi:hypothetical protein